MRIALLIEGMTEKAFLPILREFFQPRLAGRMPRLDPVPFDGRIPKGDKLKSIVTKLLTDKSHPADAVIALTDVYTGTRDFENAADAKLKMQGWAGPEPRFYAHTAQYDFEAWLIPYWEDIQLLTGHNAACPGPNPEQIDHINPPSKRIREIFRRGNRSKSYVKVRDAVRILKNKDLTVAAMACPELRAFVNTILTLCEGQPI